MKVESLVEKVTMRNGIEIIIIKTEVTRERVFLGKERYLIRVEGVFKEKWEKGFSVRHFTVPVHLTEIDDAYWELESYRGDTINFFALSDSHHPEEREALLHYCLSQDSVFIKVENDFGRDSLFCKWVKHGCLNTFTIRKRNRR
ncbi:hypothetical protein [Brevibacillus choshinensis]|uniref:Uncharacterized protein n=1 Tax=Brevibacillus choshinensis TaxID=54911 RepID=A0ABX7FIK4_BRECH|nr:hypothetical protein [Brevibacillus choshinensis]QRG65972.1 hypothetical protein JNE38_20660 [Brevibacillus choshinensis]